jgi:hypothetical protein
VSGDSPGQKEIRKEVLNAKIKTAKSVNAGIKKSRSRLHYKKRAGSK